MTDEWLARDRVHRALFEPAANRWSQQYLRSRCVAAREGSEKFETAARSLSHSRSIELAPALLANVLAEVCSSEATIRRTAGQVFAQIVEMYTPEAQHRVDPFSFEGMLDTSHFRPCEEARFGADLGALFAFHSRQCRNSIANSCNILRRDRSFS